MVKDSHFVKHAKLQLKEFAAYDEEQKYLLVNAVKDFNVERALDVGCGAGHQLLPFAEKKESFCVGIDVGEEVGQVGNEVFRQAGFGDKCAFLRSQGEKLPFADECFDVVICRVALPYMDNRQTIAEISRVLRRGGKFLLKIHAPAFYLWMLRQRLPLMSLKQLAYPVICLFGGVLNSLTGKRPQNGLWKGKEFYQTKRYIRNELARNNLRIVGELKDTNVATPSFLIEKI